MKKRITAFFLSLVLLAALMVPVTVSNAATAKVKSGNFSCYKNNALWLIQIKKVKNNKVKIGIAWSDDKSAFSTAKLFTKDISSTVNFDESGSYIDANGKPIEGKSKQIKGSITFKGKKLKCNINGEKFTAKYVPD